jgi:hypothetical protein
MPGLSCALTSAVFALVSVGAARSARAQPATVAVSSSAPARDHGPMLAVAAGIGWLDGDGVPALAGSAIAIDAGVRVSRRMVLVADVQLTRENAGRYQSVHYAGTQAFGLQVWPVETFWFRPALGFGFVQYSGGTDDRYARDGLGPAAVLAAGAELMSRAEWAMDVQFRGGALYHHGDSAALNTCLMLGVAWR